MKQEPVRHTYTCPNCQTFVEFHDIKPQYREYKEPTTKEINDLWIEVINNIPSNDNRPTHWHFACAILKKASEK